MPGGGLLSHLPKSRAQEAGGAYPADPEAKGAIRAAEVLLPGVVSTEDTATGGGTHPPVTEQRALLETWNEAGTQGLPVTWASTGPPETVKEPLTGGPLAPCSLGAPDSPVC